MERQYLTVTTDSWEYIDVEIISTCDVAGQSSIYFIPFWTFTKGGKTGSENTYYLFIKNLTTNSQNVGGWRTGSTSTSEDWNNLIFKGTGADWYGGRANVTANANKKDSFIAVIVSSNSSENILDLDSSYDIRKTRTGNNGSSIAYDEASIITKCVSYIQFQGNGYWTTINQNITRPNGANTPIRGISGHAHSTRGVISGPGFTYDGTQKIYHNNEVVTPPNGYSAVIYPDNPERTYGPGLIHFVTSDYAIIVDNKLRLGPYEYVAVSSFEEPLEGWSFFGRDSNPIDEYNYTTRGYANSKRLPEGWSRAMAGTTHIGAVFSEASNDIKITFDKNTSDTVTNMPSEITGTASVGVTIPSTVPVRSNYQFLGWSLTKTNTYPTYEANKSYNYYRRRNLTLYAIWGKNSTIKYYMNDGTSNQFGADETKTFNNRYRIKSAIPERAYYAFIGWNTAADGSGDNYRPNGYYDVDEDLTLYAQWEQTNRKVWIYTGSQWRQGIPWIYDGSQWKQGKSAFVYSGGWKEEK